MNLWIATQEAAERSGYHVNYNRQLIRAGRLVAEDLGDKLWNTGRLKGALAKHTNVGPQGERALS